MTSPGTDTELIARVVSGDRDAFDGLMRIHEDRVFSVCLRIMGDRENALDATQETFLTLFRKAGQFKGESALGTWIYRIAVNTCYDQLRKQKRRQTESLSDDRDHADVATDARFASVALRPAIERAIESLPREFQAAVILSDLEGLPLRTVADVLEISELCPIFDVSQMSIKLAFCMIYHYLGSRAKTLRDRGEAP